MLLYSLYVLNNSRLASFDLLSAGVDSLTESLLIDESVVEDVAKRGDKIGVEVGLYAANDGPDTVNACVIFIDDGPVMRRQRHTETKALDVHFATMGIPFDDGSLGG